jgi:phosphoglucomutase
MRPPARKKKPFFSSFRPQTSGASELAGHPIEAVLTTAPGNGAPIGGLKVVTAQGWFAVRPSGTEDVYKLYAESFRGSDHLRRIQEEAQAITSAALAGVIG